MRIVVTGGGTGGHIYPALEVALDAQTRGHEVSYLGSHRGQESNACGKVGMPFQGFESGPVYRISSLRGLKSLLTLVRSTQKASSYIRDLKLDAVFSTGGYASVPIVSAAHKLGIPVILHEQNTVPGRTNKIMSRKARFVCTVFDSSKQYFDPAKVVRVGMPIRKAMRAASLQASLMENTSDSPQVMVMGGSQGSAALNDRALGTALRMADKDVRWLHVTGVDHFQNTMNSLDKMGISKEYVIKSYLESQDMADAMYGCELAVCRSGAGTMAELAAFRKPSVLVPYPGAFNNHQYMNAREFEKLGAAEIVQESNLDASVLESRILGWLYDNDRQKAAREALAKWDVPDASDRILDMIEKVGSS